MKWSSVFQVHREGLFASKTCPLNWNHFMACGSVTPVFTLFFIFWFLFYCDFPTLFSFCSACVLEAVFSSLGQGPSGSGRVRFPSWNDLLAMSRQHLGLPKAASSSVKWPWQQCPQSRSGVQCLTWNRQEHWAPSLLSDSSEVIAIPLLSPSPSTLLCDFSFKLFTCNIMPCLSSSPAVGC